MNTDVLSAIGELGIVPVITIQDSSTAPQLGDALKAGGLPIAEITLRTDAADIALERLAGDPELLVGAGTVLTVAQLDRAVDCGARFIVGPGFDEDVLRRAQHHHIPLIPGIATATEIQRALRLQISTVKLFPAQQLGGAATVRALSAPFPGLRFIPTGGIRLAHLEDYLHLPGVLAVGGSWMVPAALVRAQRWPEITRLTEQARLGADRARSTVVGG